MRILFTQMRITFAFIISLQENILDMAEYKYDEESVKTLIEWIKSASFPKEMKLSEADNIIDVPRYIKANLSDISAHYPDEFYNPAITRLYLLKEKLENGE